jgi:AcrR family transcriptional regulator
LTAIPVIYIMTDESVIIGFMARLTEAQKEERRQEILAAALRCFSRNGFHNTTVADIVRESGDSQGTFYIYFQTKDDVIAALADDRIQSSALINALAEAETDPVIGLKILFDLHGRTLGDAQRTDERRVTIQGWAEALRNDSIRQRLVANTERAQQEIALLIERGQRSGRFRADADPKGVARALIALFQGLTLMTAWYGKFDAQLTAKSIEDMVRGALAPTNRDGKMDQATGKNET